MELFQEIPPRWEDRTEDDWLAYANAVKRKVYDGRFEFPREWPFYLGWNAQHSNGRARRASCRSSTTRASTSTCC